VTPLPSLDPADVHVTLSRSANADFDRLGLAGGSFRDRRRTVVDSLHVHAETLTDLSEVQFLARTTIAGKLVVALCLAHAGSPLGDKSQSVIIRGIFTPERAAELSAIGKGLSPFIQEISGRQSAGPKNKVEKQNDNSTEIAVAG
jgi:hypothetical protein